MDLFYDSDKFFDDLHDEYITETKSFIKEYLIVNEVDKFNKGYLEEHIDSFFCEMKNHFKNTYNCYIQKTIMKMNYKVFLKTFYWQIIRTKKIKKSSNCALCGYGSFNKKLNVHHHDYDYLGDEILSMNKLTVLCQECHEKYHKLIEVK